MISRRDKLLNYPWQQQRFEQHKEKVRSAKPAIDVRTPPIYQHVLTKPKKVQREKERLRRIETENVRLLQRLGDIMTTKRLMNFWVQPRPDFLNREKLFETRPHSSLPQLISLYRPSTSNEFQLKTAVVLKSPHLRTTHRCPTCSGKPEVGLMSVPECRKPWQPTRKTWNIRVKDMTALKRCVHCGHPKHQ